MYIKEHPLREMYEYNLDRQKTISEAAEEKLREKECEVDEFYTQLNKYRKQRELKDSELGKFTEAVYNNYMQTALEAIYISALGKVAPISEEAENIAKSLVENYINENGGARSIISHKSGKTYLLDTIFEAVDHAAKRDIAYFLEAEKDDEEEDKKQKEEDDKSDKEDIKLGDADGDGVDDSQDSDYGTGSDNKKNAEASDSKEKEDEKEDEEDEKVDSSSENGEDTDGDGDADEDDKSGEDSDEENESEDEEDESEDEETSIEDLDAEEVEDDEEEDEEPESDPDLDEPDTKESIEDSQEAPSMEEDEGENSEDLPDSKEELFDKLENDQDVSDAVDIIAKRISDAESKFIEKNAEDKKKIENIVNKVQDRIDAVTQDEDSSAEDIENEEQEAKIEAARYISEIRNDRFHTVYEYMVRDNMEYIMKNKALNEAYTGVDGKIDVSRVMDSSRAMYGWLETVNSIQLEKVDEDYLKKVIYGK